MLFSSIHKKTSSTFCHGKIDLYLPSNEVHSNATSTMPYDLSRFFSILLLCSCFRDREKIIDQTKKTTKNRREKFVRLNDFSPIAFILQTKHINEWDRVCVCVCFVKREKILKQFSFGIVINNAIYLRGGQINDSITQHR